MKRRPVLLVIPGRKWKTFSSSASKGRRDSSNVFSFVEWAHTYKYLVHGVKLIQTLLVLFRCFFSLKCQVCWFREMHRQWNLAQTLRSFDPKVWLNVTALLCVMNTQRRGPLCITMIHWQGAICGIFLGSLYSPPKVTAFLTRKGYYSNLSVIASMRVQCMRTNDKYESCLGGTHKKRD